MYEWMENAMACKTIQFITKRHNRLVASSHIQIRATKEKLFEIQYLEITAPCKYCMVFITKERLTLISTGLEPVFNYT